MNPPVPNVPLSPEAKILFTALNSNEEVASEILQKLWKKYDADGDGSLDFEETKVFLKDLDNAMCKVAKKALGKEEGSKLFNFVINTTRKEIGGEEVVMKELFDDMDTNKSGRIEFGEFKKALKEHASKHDADTMVESLKAYKPEYKQMEAAAATAEILTVGMAEMMGALAGSVSEKPNGDPQCKQQ